MDEAGVSDNYSDGNKAGFLTTDSHFLYVWFPSLPPSTSSHPGSHSWTQGLGILLFINPKLFSPQRRPSVQMHRTWKKMRRMHFRAPLGTATIQFFSNRCHISAILWRSHAMRACGSVWGGGGKEQRNEGRCLLTDSVVRIRPSVPRHTDASCTHTANAYIFHISHATSPPPSKKAHKTPNPPTFVYTKIKVIWGEFTHSSTEASIIFLL